MGRSFTQGPPDRPVTPREVFFNRRRFLSMMGHGLVTGPLAVAASERAASAQRQPAIIDVPFRRPGVLPAPRNAEYGIPSGVMNAAPVLGASSGRGDPGRVMDRTVAATHNNYYEFLPGRGGPVWEFCGDFDVEPWTVEITGECHRPTTLDLDDLFAFDHEERVYHFRCVERWAMNVPWSGFPLHRLLTRVEPTASARFVRFETAAIPGQMPGIRTAGWYPWPYQEALRLDEAMHDLTLVATGVYGEPLLRQHGAPVRVVVPWKYGYKSAKSIVRIELTRERPPTFWSATQPHEYGFLSNVNPNVPHPRWPQTISYWLDTEDQFRTPIFNGYGDEVADLYPDEPRRPQEALRPGQAAR